ncbi:hypothetical protein [Flavilitoribacter nigricans]|uniref:hypothetical protein n=1 Tax=Flavilitoribacter nigricans TaxID=70997 RepID=UPI0014738F09|nr:hypothetical protein [Flavilitoribacter nigricans]
MEIFTVWNDGKKSGYLLSVGEGQSDAGNGILCWLVDLLHKMHESLLYGIPNTE